MKVSHLHVMRSDDVPNESHRYKASLGRECDGAHLLQLLIPEHQQLGVCAFVLDECDSLLAASLCPEAAVEDLSQESGALPSVLLPVPLPLKGEHGPSVRHIRFRCFPFLGLQSVAC
jgi:hypothetical protein